MFKIHSKNNILQKSSLIFNQAQFNVSNTSVINNYDSRKFNLRKNLYDVIAKRSGDVAFMKLNANYKQNTLTPQMIQEIHRFLESYDVDSSIRAIFLEGPADGQTFSKGTDLKYLINNIIHKHPEKSFEYLRQLYDFAVYIGKYNKPLLVNINGPISGSAASIFTRIPLAMGTKHTRFSLNETHLGYIPDAGASYYLSRLKDDLGTFLALTGYQIDGYDLSTGGIASQRMFLNKHNLEQNFAKSHYAHDQQITSEELNGDEIFMEKYKNKIIQNSYLNAINTEIKERILDEDQVQFQGENKRLAFAEILYKHQMCQKANFGNQNSDQLNDQYIILNHLQNYENNVLYQLFIENMQGKPAGSITRIPMQTVGRCFGANTVEEIFERLKQENTIFSEQILSLLKQKSPLALKITLRLLREGQNSTWKECLEREYRVASRRIQDQELAESLKHYLFNNNKNVFNAWDVKTLQEISNDQVESYFRPLGEDQKTKNVPLYEPNLKPFALYPVKDYYNEYPDNIRFYLNQDSLRDTHLRAGQKWDVEKFLQTMGINSMNPAINVQDLREKIYLFEKLKYKKQEYLNRLCQLSGCEFSLDIYYRTRIQAIEEYFQNNKQVNEDLDKVCEEIFNQYKQTRLDQLKEISRVASVEKKQDFFLRLRRKIIDDRFVVKQNEDPDQKYTLENYPGFEYASFFPSDNKENKIEGHDPYVKKLIGDLLDKISIQKKNNLIQSFSFNKQEIDTIVNEKQFSKVLIDRIHLNNNDRINYLNVKREEYQLRFGDTRAKALDEWYSLLVETGYKSNQVKDFLLSQTNEQIVEVLKQTTPDNLRDYVYEFLNDLENLKNIQEASNNEKIEEQLRIDTAQLTKQGFSEISQLISFSNEEASTEKKIDKNDPNYIQNIFNKFVNYDNQLKDLLQVVLQTDQSKGKRSNIIEKTRQEYSKLLNTILVSKIDQIYDHKNLQNHLITKDGVKTYQFNDPYMSLIDSYIQNNLEYDIQEYVSSHTFFVYAALSLQKLELLFKKILSASKKIRSNPDQISQILREYQIDCQNLEEFQEYTNYLNKLMQTSAILYSAYQDNLIFSEDKALELQNKIKFMNEKLAGSLSFTNYAVMAFEQRELFENALEQASRLIVDHSQKETFDQTVKNISGILDDNDQPKDLKIQQLNEALDALDSLSESKEVITGFIIYAEKLDRLTQASIQGKGHYLPEYLQINEKEAEIPKFYGTVDVRMNENDWIKMKIQQFVGEVFKERYHLEKKLNNHDLLMLDFELSKFLMPENLKQTLYEELNKDMELLRITREYQLGNRDITQQQTVQYKKEQEQKLDKIRNPKAIQKLYSFRMWHQNKYKDGEMALDNFEQILKVEKSLAQEAYEAPPISQISKNSQLQEAYLQILELDQIQQEKLLKKKLTKEEIFFDEYKVAINALKEQKFLTEGDYLLNNINLFIKQINS